jgi:hypothetical protein
MLANHQSVSITGDRRIGKSSLLYNLRLPALRATFRSQFDFTNYLYVYVDLQGSLHRTPNAVLHHLLQQIERQGGQTGEIPPLDAMTPDIFEDAVAGLEQQGPSLVLLLDEFDSVTRNERLDESLFSFLRYMATNYRLCLVTASQERLGQLCHTDILGSPFFNIFAVVGLGPLSAEAAQVLITEPSTAAGRPLTDETDWILDLVGTHPLFLQIVCYYLLEAVAGRSDGTAVDLARVERLFLEEARDHFQYAWDHLSEQEKEPLAAALGRKPGLYPHYLAESRAFRQFAARQLGRQATPKPAIEESAVEEALENLWDITALAQSPLAKMSIVRRRLVEEGQEMNLPNTGRAVHALLQEYIAGLGAEETAAKDSKRWRHWFILHHRYVEEQSNRFIYTRLHIAERTFYRERKEAIGALTAMLQEGETAV